MVFGGATVVVVSSDEGVLDADCAATSGHAAAVTRSIAVAVGGIGGHRDVVQRHAAGGAAIEKTAAVGLGCVAADRDIGQGDGSGIENAAAPGAGLIVR